MRGRPVVNAGPLVTCIMPTYNRRAFVPRAVAQFLAQDYPNRELVVVDDGTDPVEDLMPAGDERVRYIRLPERLTIGAKRNLACEAARGELICHWDDDDWMADWRLSYQVSEHLQLGADVSGAPWTVLHEPSSGRVWETTWRPGVAHPSSNAPRNMHIVGATLLFSKSVWVQHRFGNLNLAEDREFILAALEAGLNVVPLADVSFYVVTCHSANTCSYPFSSSRLTPRVLADLTINPQGSSVLRPGWIEVRELTTWETSGPQEWTKKSKIRTFSAHRVFGQEGAWPECVTPDRIDLGFHEVEVLIITTYVTSEAPIRIERNEVQCRVTNAFRERDAAVLEAWKASRGPSARAAEKLCA